MVIDFSKTQLGILETLSTKWYKFLSVSDISNMSKLPASSIYDTIKPLKDKNIVIESNGRYRINFSNDISWAMKKLTDAHKLFALPYNMPAKIMEIREKANHFYDLRIEALLIFGSSASSELKEGSDIDFLIVLSEKRKESFLKFLTTEDRNFNFIEYTIWEFHDAYDEGDDFLISVLKNHILVQGDFYIRFFMERDLPVVSREIIHKRELQLNELKIKIDKLFFQDQPIVYDKIKEYIRLKVRIMLMKQGTVPSTNKSLFNLMKQYYLVYYKAYVCLTRENAKNTYSQLERL